MKSKTFITTILISLAIATTARSEAPNASSNMMKQINTLRQKILSFQGKQKSVQELVGPGLRKTLTILPATCTRWAGVDSSEQTSGGRSFNEDIGISYFDHSMSWGRDPSSGNSNNDVTGIPLVQMRVCPLSLEPGTRIVEVKAYAKAGPQSYIDVFVDENNLGIFDDPTNSLIGGCLVDIGSGNDGSGTIPAYSPEQTFYSTSCPLTVRADRAYLLQLSMNKGIGDPSSSTVLQAIQIDYVIPTRGPSTPTSVGSAN